MALSEMQKIRIHENWVKIEKKLKEERECMKKEALYRAGQIAHMLKTRYDIKNVYLYGSLAKEEYFDSKSDIDLYIENWKEKLNYWRMLNEAESIARPYNISIITDKEILPSFKKNVEKEGITL